MSIYEQGIIITPPQIQRIYWEKRCTEIKSKQKWGDEQHSIQGMA